MNNTKPKRHVRTIGTNVGQAILDAGFEHPKAKRNSRPGKPRNRKPQQSPAKASPTLKPAPPSAAAAMARMAGKASK